MVAKAYFGMGAEGTHPRTYNFVCFAYRLRALRAVQKLVRHGLGPEDAWSERAPSDQQ